MPARSFLSRYLTLLGGETFSKLCVLAAFAYLARVLSAAEYGIVEFALSITVFFVLGVESGMGLYGARIVAAAPDRLPALVPQIMLLRVLLGLPAFGLILMVATAYRSAGLGLLAINGIAVLLTPLLTQWVFQGLKQMHWVAAGTILRNVTFVVLVLLLVRAGSNIRLVAAAEVAGLAMLALFNTIILHRRLHVHFDWTGVASGAHRLFREVWFMGLSDFTWACLWYGPTLILGWIALDRPDEVAWAASSVRIVLAVHTFVFLYFFNLLPDLARDLASGPDGWRSTMSRSLSTSTWLACLIALGGTLIASTFIPAIYGDDYRSAIPPFQVAIWMIPVTWFSGHFRFSLIAAGQQRWEFAVSAATAIATVIAALLLVPLKGSVGAATALLLGGAVNLIIAVMACNRYVGRVQYQSQVWPIVATTAGCLVLGFVAGSVVGPVAAAMTGCAAYIAIAARRNPDLMELARRFVQR